MRKAAIITLGTGALLAAGSFLPALATQNPYPPPNGGTEPAYTNPCGSSALQAPVPASNTGPAGAYVQAPSGASGTSGIYGSNGYLELSGGAATQSGQISGELDAPGNNNAVYGSVGGSASGGGTVCVGSGSTTVSQGV